MNLADRADLFLGKGIREIAGPSSHRQILSWIQRTEKLHPSDTPIDDSRYAWCGVFVGNMVLDGIAAGDKLPAPPAYFQGAKRWEKWGAAVVNKQLGERGDVAVLKRKGGHHVAIVHSRANGGYNVIGGNQGDALNVRFYPYDEVVALRRPPR